MLPIFSIPISFYREAFNSTIKLAGTTLATDEPVAVKLEKRRTKHPQLHIEAKFLSMLHGGSEFYLLLFTSLPSVICVAR